MDGTPRSFVNTSKGAFYRPEQELPTRSAGGLLLATREAVRDFGDGGSVINISSVVATAAPATASVYSATKAAVDAVTRSLAKELGPRKVRVNAINPGMVETEGVHAAGFIESDFRTDKLPRLFAGSRRAICIP